MLLYSLWCGFHLFSGSIAVPSFDRPRPVCLLFCGHRGFDSSPLSKPSSCCNQSVSLWCVNSWKLDEKRVRLSTNLTSVALASSLSVIIFFTSVPPVLLRRLSVKRRGISWRDAISTEEKELMHIEETGKGKAWTNMRTKKSSLVYDQSESVSAMMKTRNSDAKFTEKKSRKQENDSFMEGHNDHRLEKNQMKGLWGRSRFIWRVCVPEHVCQVVGPPWRRDRQHACGLPVRSHRSEWRPSYRNQDTLSQQ